eukprot:36952-Pelagomonas_calceolata.AAC.3
MKKCKKRSQNKNRTIKTEGQDISCWWPPSQQQAVGHTKEGMPDSHHGPGEGGTPEQGKYLVEAMRG